MYNTVYRCGTVLKVKRAPDRRGCERQFTSVEVLQIIINEVIFGVNVVYYRRTTIAHSSAVVLADC